MKTFHGKQSIKDEYVARLRAHKESDEIVQGYYWENGKGCAVGCTIEGSDHKRYETELGIPEWLARLEDKIFEGLENEDAKDFALDFLEAIPVGVSEEDMYKMRCDLDYLRLENLLENLKQEEYGVEEAVQKVMLLNGEYADPEDERWSAAESVAWSAAESAAYSSARSTEGAAWSAAWSAARSEGGSARSVVWSVDSAKSAARSERRSEVGSAWLVALTAESVAWTKERDNLLKSLRRLKNKTY